MAAVAAGFNAIDANHDGSISRAEFARALGGGAGVTTYSAPVTYGAPAVTYAAPVTTLQPVTYAAPAAPVRAVQQTEVIIPTDRRLLAGTIIGETPVTREQLIMQGRLIEDENRMQQILQQTAQMAGYMSNAYGVGMVLTDFTHLQQAQDPIVMHGHDSRPQPGQRINVGSHIGQTSHPAGQYGHHGAHGQPAVHAKEPDAEWMFGDAATGMLGFHALADLNPLRWSGGKTIDKVIADLQRVQQHGSRPIIVKCPSGVRSKENLFHTPQQAIDFLVSQKRF